MIATANGTAGHLDENVTIDSLYPAVIECFIIILSGYVAGRFGLIPSSESKGLNSFVGHFSLPALIFLSMASLDFSSVNWTFLLAISVSKCLVFLVVGVVTLITHRPLNLGKAALYAIFCTQSNDFALGYPIVVALYGKLHPDYANYLYLVAPISLVFLNPIGFTLMEVQKQREGGTVDTVDTSAPSPVFNGISPPPGGLSRKLNALRSSRMKIVVSIIGGVLLNPVVLMTIAGIAGNFIFHHCLPVVLEGVLKVLGSAFSATALFALGLKMVGKMSALKGKALVLPCILITIKTLVLPLVTREIVSLLKSGKTANETVDLSTYGFLLGTFPTAPSVFVYASRYNLEVDMIASAMVACTFLSAPIMFVSAQMITLPITKGTEYLSELDNFLFNVSIMGFICCVWVAGVFLLSRKWQKMPHFLTLCLVLSQLMACTGAILWATLDCKVPWKMHLQFTLFTAGVFSARIWTALLAISLLCLRWRSLCFVLRMRPLFAIFGWGIPCILVAILSILVTSEIEYRDKIDPNFQYGRAQATVAALVLLCSFIITVLCLIIQQRHDVKFENYENLPDGDEEMANGKTAGCHKGCMNGGGDGKCLKDDAVSEGYRSPAGSRQQFAYCKGNQCKSKMNKSASCCQLRDVEDIGATIALGQQNDSPSYPSLYQATSHCSLAPTVVDHSHGTYNTAENSLFSPNDNLCGSDFPCSGNRRSKCSRLLQKYRSTHSLTEPEENGIVRDHDDEYQMLRHVILLLLLCLSMIVGFALCLWRLIMEEPSGIYVELEFLDGVLNFGQGFFVFIIFGLDTKLVIVPLTRRWRRFWYGTEQLVLAKWEDLGAESRQVCEQFLTYHYEKCVKDIVRDRRWRLKRHKSVFCGNEFVDWLLIVGLARNRSEGVRYGRHLLSGRVIRHIDREQHFQDLPYFYTFQTGEGSIQ